MTRLERYRLGYLLHGSILTPAFYRDQEAVTNTLVTPEPDPLDGVLDEIESEHQHPEPLVTPTPLPRRPLVRRRITRKARPQKGAA
jgi:hypothetical protein